MNISKRHITLVLLLSVFISIFTPVFQEAGFESAHALDRMEGRRISGPNRYDTAGAIAGEAFPQGSKEVIIVRGDGSGSQPNVVDALAASGFAGVMDAPILLVDNRHASVPQGTLSAINELGADKAYIIGGTAAVNEGIEEELNSRLHRGTERISEPGTNRYDTAALVARRVLNQQPANTAIIAGGYAEVDSLIAGPLANKEGYPILLVGSSLQGSTRQVLLDYDIENVIIVGGEVPVPKKVEDELVDLLGRDGVERISGDDTVGSNREGTSIRFFERFFASSDSVHVVNGYSFVDAVAASVLQAPILYTRTDRMSSPITEALARFNDYRVIGGTAVITTGLQEQIHEAVFGAPEEETDENALIRMEGIALGDSESRVISQLGQPVRKDASRYGFYWYIYNQDYNNYLQVGVLNGKVVGLFTGTGNWTSKDGLKKDMTADQLKALYPGAQESAGRTLSYVEGNTRMVMFYDNLKANQPVLGAVKVLDDQLYRQQGADKRSYRWDSVPFSKEEVRISYQQQIFDLANMSRVQFGLTPFLPCNQATEAAKLHSEDMRDRNFFSHTNPDGEAPWDRLRNQGVLYSTAGENIAANQESPVHVHWAWMNSSGHRNSLLSSNRRLGVGVAFQRDGVNSTYGSYFTQKFYSPR